MKLYEYKSYEEYVEAQTEANKRKLNLVWVKEETLKKVKRYANNASIILCHGTRNGAEQMIFKSLYPNADKVMGTEISETANKFPYTLHHDFHKVLPDFVGQCDIVYSNAFDHSFDPDLCMSVWSDQVKPHGYMFLERMVGDDNRSKASDPLEISRQELIDLAGKHGLFFVNNEPAGGRIGQSELLVFKK